MNEKQLDNMDVWFNERFEKKFNEKIKQGGYIKTWIAKVVAYNSTTKLTNVHLPNDEVNVIANIKNKSGETLVAGDIVELHSRLSTLGSSYIQVKY